MVAVVGPSPQNFTLLTTQAQGTVPYCLLKVALSLSDWLSKMLKEVHLNSGKNLWFTQKLNSGYS